MTRPLTEDSPGKQQSNYGYRIRQLERRPAPRMTPTEVCHLYSWNYDSTNTVPTATWTPVADFDAGGGYFEASETVGTWSFDYNTGIITFGVDGEYVCYGWVQFNENANNGEQRIVSITSGSSDRYIAIFPFTTGSSIIAQYKLPVVTPRSTVVGTSSAMVEVWHDHGSDLTIRDAEITVRRFETALVHGDWDPYA